MSGQVRSPTVTPLASSAVTGPRALSIGPMAFVLPPEITTTLESMLVVELDGVEVEGRTVTPVTTEVDGGSGAYSIFWSCPPLQVIVTGSLITKRATLGAWAPSVRLSRLTQIR